MPNSNSHSESNFSDYPCWCAPIPTYCAVVDDNSTPASLSQGVISVGGFDIRYFDIVDVNLTCNADPVAQVVHAQPSGFTVGTCCGDSATYELKLISNTCDGDPNRSNYNITYNETVTAAAIVADFVAAINADANAFVTASTSANNIVLTADTAGCQFQVTFASDNFIVTTITANVAPFGEASQVTASGCTPLTSSTDYHAIDFLVREFNDTTDGCNNCKSVCEVLYRVWVIDSGAGDSFITSVSTIVTGASSAASYLATSAALSCP